MNSRFIHDGNRSVGKLHHNPIQFHQNSGEGDFPIHFLPLELNIERLIAALTLGCKDVVAGGGKVEESPIKSLVKEVPPCTAEWVDVGTSHFWVF